MNKKGAEDRKHYLFKCLYLDLFYRSWKVS